MNEYEKAIKPCKAKLTWNNQDWVIPPAKDPKQDPQWFYVPEGVWDLYLGNYDRMNSSNATEKMQEMMKLSQRFAGRENPAVQKDEDGNVISGYVEFAREEISPQSRAVDSDQLVASEIEEV